MMFLFQLGDFEVQNVTPPKTNMTMDKQPFEDVSFLKNGDCPMSCEFSGGNFQGVPLI